MRLMKVMAASAVVVGLAAMPIVAQASAAKLSLSRASTDAEDANEIAGAVIIGVLATAALVGGAIVLADNDDEADSN